MPTPQKPRSSFSSSVITRRKFVYYSALATGTVFGAAPAFLRGQNLNDRINVAVIGAGGKGAGDTDETARIGGNIVALCDVDKGTIEARTSANVESNRRRRTFPEAKRYQDFRKMLEEMDRQIDAVIVATPDHVHAPASIMAMKMGKHCFCQKPLTHSVYEARLMRQVAKEKKVATQMGNQGSAGNGLRRAVEVIQAGVIGQPKELHVWSNRPIWPQGIDRPAGEDAVPDTLNWDLWLGPAPMRPFKEKVYHPSAWRGWIDFGTGALGDMACHTVNMPFRALKLGYPNVVECEETSELLPETYPKTSRIRFEFPARKGLPPLKFWWYDGNPRDQSLKPLRPHPDLTREIVALSGSLPESGCLIIADKGKLFSPSDYGSRFFLLLDGDKEYKPAMRKETQGGKSVDVEHEALRNIRTTIARSPGHYQEWASAIRGGKPAYSNFDIAAYLTEIILLGCVAMRVGVGKRLDWDGPKMKARNTAAADQFVKREYRKGWTL